MSTRITSKGQVTIPKHVRDVLGLRAGMEVDFVLEHGRAFLKPLEKREADLLAGSLKRYAPKHRKKSERDLLEAVHREVAQDAAREGLPHRHQRAAPASPRR